MNYDLILLTTPFITMNIVLLYLFIQKLMKYEKELIIRYIYPAVYEVESIEKLLLTKIENNIDTDKTIVHKLNIKTKVMENELCILVNPYYFLKIRICENCINYYLQKIRIYDYDYVLADEVIPEIYNELNNKNKNKRKNKRAFSMSWDENIKEIKSVYYSYENMKLIPIYKYKYLDKIPLIYDEIIQINNNAKYNRYLYFIDLP